MDNESGLSLRAQLLDRVRFFNRRYFNPFALSFAGRPGSFWSVIQHTGRRSGKAYTTPVVATRQGESLVIPLPYGRGVDWSRNVLAAGGCRVIAQGKVYRAAQPAIVSFESGIGAFTGLAQVLLLRSETAAFLRLNQVEADPEGGARYQAFIAAYPLERGLWIVAILAFLAMGLGRRLRRRR